MKQFEEGVDQPQQASGADAGNARGLHQGELPLENKGRNAAEDDRQYR